MNLAAVHHRATDSFCYPVDSETLHIRLQTAANDALAVAAEIGDPHEWHRRPGPGQEESWAWRSQVLSLSKAGSDGIHDFWEFFWKPPYKRCRYLFRLTALDGGVWTYGEKGIHPFQAGEGEEDGPSGDYWNSFVFPYINQADLYRAPSWVPSTVWYQIFPERFRNGNPENDPPGTLPWGRGKVSNSERYGGDLAGIMEKLDHLAGLGITGLYLTPIFAAPSVHKYDTEDYLRVDPSFGGEEDLRRLVEGCHARGIRVMLDAVFNHSGKGFGPWLDVLAKGRESRFASWFHIRSWPLFPKGRDTGDSWDAGFETFSFTTRMPKLDTSNPEVRDYLLGVGERYVRDFGIDGWRLDVANEIDHDFWRLFRKRIKALNPEVYILGEIWHDAMPWLRGDQYDAVMNYPYGSALVDFLQTRPRLASARDLAGRLSAVDFSYPLPVLRHAFNLLDSHDTERLIHRLGDLALARLGWLLLFALPGSPCIYYGTEYALSGGGDPDNRRCMVWEEGDQDQEQYAFIKDLVALRKARWASFAAGEREFRFSDLDPGLFALAVGEGRGRLVFVVNRSGKAMGPAALSGLLGPWSGDGQHVLLRDPREGEARESLLHDEEGILPRGFRVYGLD